MLFTYTIRDQLGKLGDPALTTYPFSAKYTYHANGTVAEAEFYNAGSPATAKRYRYSFAPTLYDALNRLKSADFSSWSGTAWTSTLAHDLAGITYDRAGNLTALQRYREPATATLIDNLTYSNATTSNRLNSVTDAVTTTTETWDAETGSFTYDANGNLKTAPAPYGITSVTYDQQNLPITLIANAVTTNYRYDQIGQRITKQVGAGSTEFYLLEGASPLGVFTVNAAGTVTSSFFNVMAGDKVIGRHPSTGSRVYYHTDLLGSTRAVVTGTTVVEAYDFEPFGLLMPGRSLLGSTKERFTGKELDSETGLTYFGARYYLTAVGRWGSVDPATDASPSWSGYNYALNNPLSLVDPDGMAPEDWARAVSDFTRGLGNGLWSGGLNAIRGTVQAVGNAIAHPIQASRAVLETAKTVLKAAKDPSGTAAAIGAAIGESVGRFADAEAGQQGEVVGEAIMGAYVGAKVSGLLGEALAGTAMTPPSLGRTGAQARLKQLAKDDMLGSADRGWITQEMNSIGRGQRSNIRRPPGKELAHERGREAAKGYSYEQSNLQDRDLHQSQHRYDNKGRANKERPLPEERD